VTRLFAPEVRGTPLAAALAAPERLLAAPGTRFVKDHRRTAVAAATVDGREVFVKRFKPYAWYRRLEWLFAPSPARRCWDVSRELEAAGFRVAPALAATESRRFAIPGDSYFVTMGLAGALPVGRFFRELAPSLPVSARRRLLAALARELRRFHDAGFYSKDANADNFLVRLDARGTPEFFLLDLENVRRPGSVSHRRRTKNLVQLHGPVRGLVSLHERLRFVREYAGEPLAKLRAWLGELARVDDRKLAEYRARR